MTNDALWVSMVLLFSVNIAVWVIGSLESARRRRELEDRHRWERDDLEEWKVRMLSAVVRLNREAHEQRSELAGIQEKLGDDR